MARRYLGSRVDMVTNMKIEVKQLGLSTGKVVRVRIIRSPRRVGEVAVKSVL